jgi:hypothetical protein
MWMQEASKQLRLNTYLAARAWAYLWTGPTCSPNGCAFQNKCITHTYKKKQNVFTVMPHILCSLITQGVVSAKTAMLPTAKEFAVDPRIMLYAARHEAPLPPGYMSKV